MTRNPFPFSSIPLFIARVASFCSGHNSNEGLREASVCVFGRRQRRKNSGKNSAANVGRALEGFPAERIRGAAVKFVPPPAFASEKIERVGEVRKGGGPAGL